MAKAENCDVLCGNHRHCEATGKTEGFSPSTCQDKANCNTCLYSVGFETGDLTGSCRRRSPVINDIAVGTGDSGQYHRDACWPKVDSHGWCGEHVRYDN